MKGDLKQALVAEVSAVAVQSLDASVACSNITDKLQQENSMKDPKKTQKKQSDMISVAEADVTQQPPAVISPAETAVVPITAIVKSDLFGGLFPIEPAVEQAIAESIRKDGFRAESPLTVWDKGGELILLDGYTRLRGATKAGLTELPVVKKSFADEVTAFYFAVHLQRDRRQLSRKQMDAHIVRAVKMLDTKLTPGSRSDLKHGKKPGKSSKATAERIGTTLSKVEQTRAVLARGDAELVTALTEGDTTLASAYKKVTGQPTAAFDTSFRTLKDKARIGSREFDPVSGYGENYAGDVLNTLPACLKNAPVRFWDNTLTVPANVADKTLASPGGNIVCLCSYTDLFAGFVKPTERDTVLGICRDNEQWLFKIDTAECAAVVEADLPENICLCLTVFRQEQVPDALRALRALAEKRRAGSGPRVLALRCIPQDDMRLHVSCTGPDGVTEELGLTGCADWVIVSPATGDMVPCDECLAHVLLEAHESNLPVYFEGSMQLSPKELPALLTSDDSEVTPIAEAA